MVDWLVGRLVGQGRWPRLVGWVTNVIPMNELGGDGRWGWGWRLRSDWGVGVEGLGCVAHGQVGWDGVWGIRQLMWSMM